MPKKKKEMEKDRNADLITAWKKMRRGHSIDEVRKIFEQFWPTPPHVIPTPPILQ